MKSVEDLERRNCERLRPGSPLPGLIGVHDGVVVDFSHAGARVRHDGGVKIGSLIRLAFLYGKARFRAVGEVLASRVVAIGRHDAEAIVFETRLRFQDLDVEAH
jgi:hypothetical protein